MSFLPLVLAATALGQGFETHHPVIPSSSVATEGGPGALWVNPANMSYDPDGRYGVFFSRAEALQSPTSLAVTGGIDGLGFGLHNTLTPVGSEGAVTSDWSLDYATSIALPERLSIGLLMSWNFMDGGQNYLGYDAGLSWRPLPWLGLSGVAQNIGSPDPSGRARARSAAGLALRPLGPLLTLGVDYAHLFDADAGPASATLTDADLINTAVRLRPVEGLYLRGGFDLGLDTQSSAWTPLGFGMGLEFYFDGIGAGYVRESKTEGFPGYSGWVGTDEPGESLLESGRKVPILTLDRTPDYAPRGFLFASNPGPSWLDTLELLRRVETEKGVRGLVLALGNTQMSWARYRELRQRIVALEASGKPVIVYLKGSPSNGAYYVATGASQIVLHPAGDLNLIGLATELQYVKGLLDIVGVEQQFVRRAEYKSATEMTTRTEPSQAALDMTNAYLDDLHIELVRAIVQGRKASDADAQTWIDEGPWTAQAAIDAGIVDAVAYPDELQRTLDQIHGGRVATSDLRRAPQAHSPWEEPAQIAVVYVDGVIVSGESSNGGLLGQKTCGSDTLVRMLEQAARDAQVKSVVLRVDSPGGSSLASDEIWRAVELVKREGKPVVVSMGGVAASGGYYVSAGADVIYAQPNTLTGSIGVYAGKLSAESLFENMGIGVTSISRGRNADMSSMASPWDDVQRAKMQELVDAVYAQFKSRVAEGRDLSEPEVEDLARGRVWSGAQAHERGLVDELGGLQDAIGEARLRAGIAPHRKIGLVSYSPGGSVFESLAPTLIGKAMGPAKRLLPAPTADPTLERIVSLIEPWQPAMIWALHREEALWMMNPWLTDVQTR
jgi:protease IV